MTFRAIKQVGKLKPNNILVLVNRTDWFMETFAKIRSTVDKVYEIVFEDTIVKPFPFENYQKVMGEGKYQSYRLSLQYMPSDINEKKYSQYFVIDGSKIRFNSALPERIMRHNSVLITHNVIVKYHPEMQKVLKRHWYYYRYKKPKIYFFKPINPEFMFLSGRGFHTQMRYFHNKQKYLHETDYVKDIDMTLDFYCPGDKTNPRLKKLLINELRIEKIYDRRYSSGVSTVPQ